MLWGLFVQAGPVEHVHVPKDKVTNSHQGFGFVEFKGEADAEYAIKIMNMVKLYGRPIRVNRKAGAGPGGVGDMPRFTEIGANLFIGNLDIDVDEKLLYDTFSAFGVIVGNTPKVMRDPDTGMSKGFAFVNYESFEAADSAIANMNNQVGKGKRML